MAVKPAAVFAEAYAFIESIHLAPSRRPAVTLVCPGSRFSRGIANDLNAMFTPIKKVALLARLAAQTWLTVDIYGDVEPRGQGLVPCHHLPVCACNIEGAKPQRHSLLNL